MRYNVGDEVRVKKELSLDHKYDGFCWVVPPMEAFLGKVITIKEIRNEPNKGDYYVVEENEWFWTDEMLEPVPLFSSGGIVPANDPRLSDMEVTLQGFGLRENAESEWKITSKEYPILKQVDSETIKIIDCFNKETRYRWDGCKWNEIGTKKSTGIESRKEIRKRLLKL